MKTAYRWVGKTEVPFSCDTFHAAQGEGPFSSEVWACQPTALEFGGEQIMHPPEPKPWPV